MMTLVLSWKLPRILRFKMWSLGGKAPAKRRPNRLRSTPSVAMQITSRSLTRVDSLISSLLVKCSFIHLSLGMPRAVVDERSWSFVPVEMQSRLRIVRHFQTCHMTHAIQEATTKTQSNKSTQTTTKK
jgi:hypothetical protein